MSEAAQLLGRGTWIQPGPATLVVRDAGWVLLVPGSKKEVVEAAWTALGDGPTADDFLDRLMEAGGLESLDKLPAILYALMDGTTAHIGVKGKTPLAVYTEGGARHIAGTDDEPLARETVEGVRRIAFGDLPPEEPLGGLRLDAGVSRVRGFVRATVDPAELGDDARTALAEQVEKDGRSIEDPEAKRRRAERPPPAPKPSTPSAPVRKPMMATRPSGAMPTTPRQTSAPAKPAESAGPSVFDDLFGDKKPEPTPAPVSDEAVPEQESAASPDDPAPATTAEDSATAAADPATAAPDPAPSSADPAPASADPAPASADEAPPPAPGGESTAAPAAEAAQAPAAEQPATPVSGPAPSGPSSSGKRRLVSTSLFDRKRRPAPSTDTAEDPTPGTSADAASAGRTASAETAEPAPEPAPSPAVATEPSPAPEPEAVPAAAPSVAPTGEQQPSPMRRPSSATSMPTPPPPEDDDDSPVTLVAPIDQDATTSAASLGFGSELDATGAYDDLFGKTVFRSIEDAAVRRTEEDEHEDSSAESDVDSPEQDEDSPEQDESIGKVHEDEGDDQPETLGKPAAPTADAASSAIGGEFIDWVPGVGRAAPEIAQAAARKASQQAPVQPAYPQVHLAERPPAPVTGPPRAVPPTYGSAPVTREDLGFSQQPGTPSLQAQPGQQLGPQQFGASFPGAQAPAAPTGPGAQPPTARTASAPHPVAPSGPPPMAAPTPGVQAPAGTARPQATTGGSAAPAPQTAARAVMIPGVLCPNGHANSPERHECRTCRSPLEHTTRTVPRPPLGYVDISTGNRIILDRSAVIGRRPRASRVSAEDVPQLITVPSPQQDISRSHLELRLEGWHVVATDLDTTNGTTLMRPGMEPVRLRSGEGVVLGEGDQLDLGDGILLMMRGMA